MRYCGDGRTGSGRNGDLRSCSSSDSSDSPNGGMMSIKQSTALAMVVQHIFIKSS